MVRSNWRPNHVSGSGLLVNSLRPRPNRRHFADDIFKCIFQNENECISPRISLKFVLKVRINNTPALVQIMAWRRPGDKPLSEPMMVSLLTHICVTRPQWFKFVMNFRRDCHTVMIHPPRPTCASQVLKSCGSISERGTTPGASFYLGLGHREIIISTSNYGMSLLIHALTLKVV